MQTYSNSWFSDITEQQANTSAQCGVTPANLHTRFQST